MKIEVEGTEVLDDLSNKVHKVSKHAMDVIGQSIKSQILLNWKQGKDPSGKAWTPLKPSTIRAKKRKSGKVIMLKDTGNMRNSLNYKSREGAVEIGYSVHYSVFHQLGTRFMPQRKILPTELEELDTDEIKEIILNDILPHK